MRGGGPMLVPTDKLLGNQDPSDEGGDKGDGGE